MKKRYIVLIAFVVTTFSATAGINTRSSHADSIAALKKIIQKSDMVSSSAIGFTGAPASNWYAFAYLATIATDQELLTMTYDKSPALRLYAYTGLMHKKYKQLKSVEKRLSTDTAKVSSMSGCMVDHTTVSELAKNVDNWYYAPYLQKFEDYLRQHKTYAKELYATLLKGGQVKRIVIK